MARYAWFVLFYVSLLCLFSRVKLVNSQPVRAKDPFCFSREERYDKVKNGNVFEIRKSRAIKY